MVSNLSPESDDDRRISLTESDSLSLFIQVTGERLKDNCHGVYHNSIASCQTQPVKIMAWDCRIIVSSVKFIITFRPSDLAATDEQLTIHPCYAFCEHFLRFKLFA